MFIIAEVGALGNYSEQVSGTASADACHTVAALVYSQIRMKKLALIVGVSLLLWASAYAGDRPLQPYTVLIIQKFTVDPDLMRNGAFPTGYEDVLQKTLFARLLTDRTFPQVIEGPPDTKPPQAISMEGQVTEFAKGNRVARVAIGYGAGSAKMRLILVFRDLATGREVLKLEQTGRYAGFGNLTGGSADTARNESARKVVDGLLKKISAAR